MSTDAPTWHVGDDLLARYIDGGLDLGRGASVEAHLLGCDECRARLTAQVPPQVSVRVAGAWSGLRQALDVPRLPVSVRALRSVGLSPDAAVLLAGARSMSTAWTVATVLVLAFAALAAFTGTDEGRAAYLIVAPLIPVAGVVAAFGPATDPLTDLTRATPFSAARLVLIRSAGVASTSIPLAVGIGWVLPGTQWLAFAWLAPALAFVLVVLTASTWVDPVVAGGVVAVGWSAVVSTATRLEGPIVPVAGAVQPLYLGLAAAAGLVLVLRVRSSNSPGGIA